MMKLSGMVGWFSEITGYPERQVGEMARSLQKAGFIKTGQPGRYGGAVMDEKDAAALTVAVMAAERKRRVTGAVEAVEDFGALRSRDAIQNTGELEVVDNPISEIFGLPSDHTFLDFLGAAIRHEAEFPRLPSGAIVLGYGASISFPGLWVGAKLAISGPPRREISVVYGTPDERDGVDALRVRERAERGDQFRVTREVDSRFFYDLHIRLFSETEYQAQRRAVAENGGGDE